MNMATILYRDLKIQLPDDASVSIEDADGGNTTITVRRNGSVADLPSIKPVPEIGTPFAGGFFAGLDMDDKRYGLIVSLKAEGQRDEITWKDALDFCKSVRSGGFDDWRAPTKDELYIIYRNLGPNLTEAEAFKCGQPEAFDERWYWTSTEYGSSRAWDQHFGGGGLYCGGKGNRGRVRAVRKVLI